MKKRYLIIFIIVFCVGKANSQINPIDSPYLNIGNFTVVSDSDMTSLNIPLLFFRPNVEANYPVFMFQLGANGIGSNAINRHSYDLFMRHLASYGFVVIVIDDSQAGFPTGASFKAAHTWYKNKCIDNTHWLSTYADVNKFIVGGHSNGGVNASAILVDRPNEINGIVFFDSYPSPGVFGIGAHDVSEYTGKVLSLAADENVPDTYDGGYQLFTTSSCKTFVNIEGLDHGGFGDYVLASQPVGSIGRDDATATIRHFVVSWFLSEFQNNYIAAQNLVTPNLQPNTTKEFLNDCGTVSINQAEINSTILSPNPVSDFLSIKSDIIIQKLLIYNAYGQLVFQKDNFQSDSNIDLKSLSKGLYFVSLIDSKARNVFSKIIVKN